MKMKYLFYGFLTGIFLIYIAEIPFGFFKANGKHPVNAGCCCKTSVVCVCRHINKTCRLNKQAPPNTKSTFLNGLGCGFLKDKSASSAYQYPKEFHPISSPSIFIQKSFNFFPLNKKHPRMLLLDRRVDKPPAIIPRFSL